jgi:cytochrome c553
MSPTLVPLVAAAVLGLVVAPAAAGPLDAPGAVKTLTCTACHGAAGNSKVDGVPTLAGMTPAYFKKAIEDYAVGRRPSPEMEPYAKAVKALGLDEIAGYYAAQTREPTAVAVDRAAAARGAVAAAPCASCHGTRGEGDPSKLVPALAGQPPGYLRNQMLLFRTERRSPGDEALQKMKEIMKPLSDATLADLAAHYATLR